MSRFPLFSHAVCPNSSWMLRKLLWLQIFDEHMPGPNQLSKLREDVEVTADDLLRVPVVCPAANCARRIKGKTEGSCMHSGERSAQGSLHRKLNAFSMPA